MSEGAAPEALAAHIPLAEREPRAWPHRIENAIVSLALAAMVLLPIAEIALRALLRVGIPGVQALTQHLVLAVGLLGPALAARDGRLLTISTLQLILAGRARAAAHVFSNSVAAAVTAFLCIASVQFVQSERGAGADLIPGLPTWWVELLLPIGFALILVRLLWHVSSHWPVRIVAVLAVAGAVLALGFAPLHAASLIWPLLAVIVVATALGGPVFALLGGAALVLFWGEGLPIASLPLDHYRLVVNPSLPAVPLFTLAGYLLAESQAPARLIRVFQTLFGRFRAGPAFVTVFACAFFTAFTGASGVTILALGGLLLPLLVGAQYREGPAIGLITSAGSLGVLLPPSLPLILFAVVAKVPLEKMFLAAVLPGLLMAALLLAWGVRQRSRRADSGHGFDARAVALFRKEGNLDGELGAMKNIAIAQALDLNQSREAQTLLSQVLALALKSGDRREIMQARLYLGEASYRAGELQKAAALWEQGLAAARELKAPEEEWKALYSLGLIERDKGDLPAASARWTAAAALIEAGRTQLRSSDLRQRFLADKRDVYDSLIASAPDPERRLAWLERARSRSLQDKIAAPPPSLSELSGRLPEGTAMLVYWVAASQAGVLWIAHDANGWIDIPWSGGSSSRLTTFLRELRSDSTASWQTGAREWGELLMAKAVQAARAPANLIIVPDGPLTGVPFDALIPSGNQLLIERHTTWLAPTTRSLIAAEAPRGWGWPWQRQLLAFGDPAVGAVLPGDQSWQSLPRAAAEIRAASDALNGRSEVHLGVQAQKAAFLRASPAPVIHLATHALADLENPARSRILFAAPGGSPAYLFLPEAAALPMRGVELVTLSACETESGQVVRGEGPLNFSRAFLEAGASSAVSTLWAVSDQSAEFIMSRMYQAMAEREPKAAALRRAKLSAIAEGGAVARPGFWAPYVISGDGGRPLRPFLSWSVLLVLAATALAGIAMLLAIRRAPRAESSRR